ncbi:MAG: hypothetical protein ACYSX1_09040 [Planctomycetota bacterium]|jgi:hypothetical protein
MDTNTVNLILGLWGGLGPLIGAGVGWYFSHKTAVKQLQIQSVNIDKQIEAAIQNADRQFHANVVSASRREWLNQFREAIAGFQVATLSFVTEGAERRQDFGQIPVERIDLR